jgi:hypothetical protein
MEIENVPFIHLNRRSQERSHLGDKIKRFGNRTSTDALYGSPRETMSFAAGVVFKNLALD